MGTTAGERGDRPPREDSPLEEVRRALDEVAAAQLGLHRAVQAARRRGSTWAELGKVLGVSRQAAFKRFGTPRDPRTGAAMTSTDTTGLAARTEQVFALVDAGDHATLRGLMTDQTAEVLTRDRVLDTWAQVVGDSGNLVRCRDTALEHPDGTPVGEEPVLGTVVGRTTIECEAGEWLGRVAFDGDGRVIGLLVVPPGTTDLPF